MLRVTGLCAGYASVPVLAGVDIDVRPGTAMAVLGANGMGKTTLMRAMMGFLTVTAGQVMLDGRDLTAEPPQERARAGLGYVPQGRGIFLRMTVRDQLRYAMIAKGRPAGNLSDVLDRFPVLMPLLDRTGDALSGGERQLVALACCLSTRPGTLLLDEPTEGLQPSFVDQILELLIKLKQQDSVTILLAEQNLEFAAALCDQVSIMRKGSIAATAPVAAIREASTDVDLLLAGEL